jgi:tripartite-type tricarboxylate transporter receptor subunit TctC
MLRNKLRIGSGDSAVTPAARLLLVVAFCGASCPSVAQTKLPDYPLRPVTIVVGFSAGSTTDATARVMARRLSDALGQQFVVLNREGAAATLSGSMVAKSKPDGYTLLWSSASTLVTAPLFNSNIGYDPGTDFSPITAFCYLPYMIVSHPSVPAKNISELIALARSKPDALAYASTGVGGALHLAIELMQHMANVRLTHVPYKGTPTIITDLISGQIQLAIMSVNLVVPQARAKRMRPLAVTTAYRTELMPEVPTMAESGLKGYEVRGWYGLAAPAKVPSPVIGTIYKAFVDGLDHPEAKAAIAREGGRAGGEPPEQFSQFLRSERELYRKLIDASNLRTEVQPELK